jgi:general secretion pathway protein C
MKKLFDRFKKKSSTPSDTQGESPMEIPLDSPHEVLEGQVVLPPDSNDSNDTSNTIQTETEAPLTETPLVDGTSERENTRTRLARVFNGRRITTQLSSINYRAIAERTSRMLQRRGYGFYGKMLTILVCAFFLADVLAIIAGSRIPEPPVTRSLVGMKPPRTLESFGIIMSRNLFSRKGLIPGEQEPAGAAGFDPGGAPVKTTLPFNLLGTVILRDEMRSVAAIEDKSANIVYPVRIDEEIPGKAKIVKIEPTRVIFVNTTANRREFVDLPEDAVIKNMNTSTTAAAPGIEQVAANQFNIDRKEVDKALSDLNNILTQARAVPNFENGVAAGYKLFQIVPHSIYDQLGLKNGDVIAGIDGQPVTDPGKAFELLNSLKTRANLELQVKRDGKLQTNSYEIH